jgi:hypothetical protein
MKKRTIKRVTAKRPFITTARIGYRVRGSRVSDWAMSRGRLRGRDMAGTGMAHRRAIEKVTLASPNWKTGEEIVKRISEGKCGFGSARVQTSDIAVWIAKRETPSNMNLLS